MSGLEPPRWLWLWAPLVAFLVPFLVHAWSLEAHDRWVASESGLVEILTALVLAAAVTCGVLCVRRGAALPGRWLRVWYGLLGVGCLYFLGEELSWGQHLFGWPTPAALASINEQGETNLHNIRGWPEAVLDQGLRGLLTFLALAGGVVAPLVLRERRAAWDPAVDAKPWLWPTLAVLPSAVLALLANLPRKLFAAFDRDVPAALDVRGGETKECLLAFFLMVYLASALARLGRARRPDPVRTDAG